MSLLLGTSQPSLSLTGRRSVVCADSAEAPRSDSEEAPPAEFVLPQLRVHLRHRGGQDGAGADPGRCEYTPALFPMMYA